MRILSWIQGRVSQSEDSDTRRFQKTLVVVTALVGSAATVMNALPFVRDGLPTLASTYLASAAVLGVGGLVILAWPRLYVPVTFVLLLDVLVFPALTQVFAGGYSSGILAIPWALFAPLGAALALGARYAVVHLGLFSLTVIGVALVEPYAMAQAPQISTSTLLSYDVASLLSLGAMAAATSLYLLRQVEKFRAQAEGLLRNVLPSSVAERLKDGEDTIADRHDQVTVLFADIVDFTRMSSEADPRDVVEMLNTLFSEFDTLAARHGVEKIKTIGDAYMAAAGVPDRKPDHAGAALAMARDMQAVAQAHPGFAGYPLRLRIGINTGPVVAGVIGTQRLIYDIWGDAVNVASRMESTAPPDHIQVTNAVRHGAPDQFEFVTRDPLDVKGKGLTTTYTLTNAEPVGDGTR